MRKIRKLLSLELNSSLILRKKSIKIDLEKIDKKYFELVQNMIFSMVSDKGIGLAAPQIGKNIRLVIINHKEKPFELINPVITRKSRETIIGEEGCLSVPGVFGKVKRHAHIECEYYNLAREKYILKAEGLLARVIQHEIDHLNGVLFIDKLV